MYRLAIITTHPIQYYAPLFRVLHRRHRIDIKVFYTWGQHSVHKFDPGFCKQISWDTDLLGGYSFEWAENTSTAPGSHHFQGIITPKLINQIAKYQPSAILVFGWAYQSHLRVIRHFHHKLPVHFRGDSTLLDERPGLKSILKTIFLRWVYRHVDTVFYPGTNSKRYFMRYGLKENQLLFAPHAIDNDHFTASRHTEAGELRRQLSLTDNDILILFAGKFEEKKDPLLLLDAFSKLNRPEVHLLFAGNGRLEHALKLIAANRERVHFMDFQNQTVMPAVYQAADLFCLPSKGPQESWGLAVNEAMASARTVLVSDQAGCAVDLVKNAANGYIFEHGNAVDLLKKLNMLTESRESLIEMGSQSAEIIQDWNFTAIAEAIERITQGVQL